MNKAKDWDLKTWLMILGFFGFTGAGSFLTFGRNVLGWMVSPTVDAAQGRALAHQDSVNALRFDSLQASMREATQAVKTLSGKVDTLAATVAEMPGAAAAARRRQLREQAQRRLLGSLTDDRSTFRAFKGDGIP